MKEIETKKPLGLIDELKIKLIEIASDYIKKNMKQTQNQILRYVEKNIERKIKKEVKKTILKSISITLLSMGIIFLLYGLFALLSLVLKLPDFTTPLFFGIFLLLVGLIIYLFYT
ncbi:MAG: hypothetical protein KC589_10230 [Nanoarchaeota archaeon]|nr:hypothetical protein [Nanoarchaeota archaeon]